MFLFLYVTFPLYLLLRPILEVGVVKLKNEFVIDIARVTVFCMIVWRLIEMVKQRMLYRMT